MTRKNCAGAKLTRDFTEEFLKVIAAGYIDATSFRQPARFLQLLIRAGFSARRNRPYFRTGIRTLRKTIRCERSGRTDAQNILVQ